jgi:hypothetical protein
MSDEMQVIGVLDCIFLSTQWSSSNQVDTSFVDSITWGEGGQALFNGEQIRGRSLFEVLQRAENWIVVVDCYCSRLNGERCHICLEIMNMTKTKARKSNHQVNA